MDPFVVLITGMCVVFLGIVVLILVVKLMGLCCGMLNRKERVRTKNTGAFNGTARTTAAASAAVSARSVQTSGNAGNAAGVRTPEKELPLEKRRELIAVISASIAEAAGMETDGLRIRSIRKL